jgi:hypothetical protein
MRMLLVVGMSLLALSCVQMPVVNAQENSQLKADIANVQSQIQAAVTEDGLYSGGLVKSLIAVRLAILRQTAAMLEQKATPMRLGVSPAYKVDGKVFTLPATASQLRAEVDGEIAANAIKIREQEAEAARYTGGLTQAMSLATLATLRQTQAMLEQKQLSLKFGLPQYVGFMDANRAAAPATPPAASVPVAHPALNMTPSQTCLKIQTFDSSVLSTNNVYMELAWKVDVENSCAAPASARAHFTILDKDDFELDTTSESIFVPGNAIAHAGGKMLVSPIEKAKRLAKQSAALSSVVMNAGQ